ncbi:MAG TPA: PfkB family carbohydrate kinase [Gaiellales bacterium]
MDRYVDAGLALAGGNALNVAVGLAGAGIESHYLGAVGRDEDGHLVLRTASAASVDVSRVRRLDAPTGVTLVRLSHDGERSFVEERLGASGEYRVTDGDIAFMRSCGWVHMANLAEADRVAAHLRGVPVSYDFALDHTQAAIERYAPRLAIAFFSGAGLARDEAVALAGRAIDAGAEEVIVTRGRGGSMAVNSAVTEVPAQPVEVVDTLGAGDALIAAVISARVRGLDLEEALEAGSAAAARACTHHGAWEQT